LLRRQRLTGPIAYPNLWAQIDNIAPNLPKSCYR
jgi:hypothetical protein